MKIAIRRLLVALAWVGLLLGHRAAANDWAAPQAGPDGLAEVIPRGETLNPMPGGMPGGMPGATPPVVGEHQPPVGGLFGDTPPAACEFCGGGGCLPPTWSLDTSIAVVAMTRPSDRTLTIRSLPAGQPFPVETSGTNAAGQAVESQFLNDVFQTSVMETHSQSPTVSPALNFTISRFLGRDGEQRDHFIEFTFQGLERFSATDTVGTNAPTQAAFIPFYSTTPFNTALNPNPTPTILEYFGSLNSPFPNTSPTPTSLIPSTLQVQAFTPLDKIFDHAFNRAFYQSFNYIATYNDWELNYRFAGHNQPDQLVMNPNGRWYRECETGYYYSYFFGARSMVIDERFDYFSSGASFNVNPDGSMGSLSSVYQGRYVVRSYNTLLGFQTGGKLEYRFCRWTVDAHGNAGMYLNVASQESRIQTNIDGSTTDNPVSASEDVVAFAGGFGVAGSYKFLPNLTGHVAYDMLWVGDIARAPEQMVFSSMAVTAPEINTKGSVFYNGVTFGVELDW